MWLELDTDIEGDMARDAARPCGAQVKVIIKD